MPAANKSIAAKAIGGRQPKASESRLRFSSAHRREAAIKSCRNASSKVMAWPSLSRLLAFIAPGLRAYPTSIPYCRRSSCCSWLGPHVRGFAAGEVSQVYAGGLSSSNPSSFSDFSCGSVKWRAIFLRNLASLRLKRETMIHNTTVKTTNSTRNTPLAKR
jgi:hypothetical protein